MMMKGTTWNLFAAAAAARRRRRRRKKHGSQFVWWMKEEWLFDVWGKSQVWRTNERTSSSSSSSN
jgi:hypothetical protein